MREFELLQHVYDASRSLGPAVVVGPGDDMAVLRVGDRDLLVAVDQLVAGRHVTLETTPLELVGRKAVTRSLSDVAAMAARPLAGLVSVTLPPVFGAEQATALFDAMRAAGASYGCPLVGGDIAVHAAAESPLVCSVTVLAEPGPGGPRLRSAAQAGDTLYVTGALGGSVDADGGGRHLTFAPRIDEAIAIAEALGDRLHAMIDISDGLGRDASHIALASGVGIEIDAERVPCHTGLGWREAMGDGEDYELLFSAAVEPADAAEALERVGDRPAVTAIGRVVVQAAGAPLVAVLDRGSVHRGEALGWEHGS